MSARRASSLIAASLVAASGLGVAAAGPAFAKSSIGLRASAHTVMLGQRIELTAHGSSDDLGSATIRLCVQEHVSGGAWHVVGCGHEGALRVGVTAERRGELVFRSELVARNAKGHLIVDRTSPAVTVHVR